MCTYSSCKAIYILNGFLLFRNVQTRQDPKRLPNLMKLFHFTDETEHTYRKTTPIVELWYGFFPSGYNTGKIN